MVEGLTCFRIDISEVLLTTREVKQDPWMNLSMGLLFSGGISIIVMLESTKGGRSILGGEGN
jgi:hypothetical protein